MDVRPQRMSFKREQPDSSDSPEQLSFKRNQPQDESTPIQQQKRRRPSSVLESPTTVSINHVYFGVHASIQVRNS